MYRRSKRSLLCFWSIAFLVCAAGTVLVSRTIAVTAGQTLSLDGDDENKRTREKEASAFAVEVGERIGLSEQVIETYRRDAKQGHLAPPGSIYVKPPKKKKTP